jgi:uncharacterized pyridoxamine 5'-phosphate oxidase family protein
MIYLCAKLTQELFGKEFVNEKIEISGGKKNDVFIDIWCIHAFELVGESAAQIKI